MTVILLIVVLFLAWRFMPAKGIQSMTMKELKAKLYDKDKVFIDVRSKGEFKRQHIPQFKNMPLGSDFSTLPKDKEIVVICQSGMRSMQACKQLKKQGYTNVYNVRGGMNAY